MKYFYFLLITVSIFPQKLFVSDPYLSLDADAKSPLYTTYTAAIDRSQLYGDKGYKMDYYSDCSPITYSGDQAGKFYCIWKVDQVVIMNKGEYLIKPVITSSFPDLVIMEYEPFRGIKVQETFFVYSSSIAIISMQIKNIDNVSHSIELYPILELGNDSLLIKNYNDEFNSFHASHYESKYRLISSLYKNEPYPTNCENIFSVSSKPYSYGGYSGGLQDFYSTIKTDYYSENRNDSLNNKKSGYTDFIVFHNKYYLNPGEEINFRYSRGWQSEDEDENKLMSAIEKLKNENLQKYVDENVRLFSKIPRIRFDNREEKIVYIGAFNLVRGCMLPPTDSTKTNFYVFSREPLWGWGHGHQVLHESLSMLAYVFLDPRSAQGSQYIYIDQQRENGLIAYRHGPRGLQDYPHFSKVLGKDMSTTSAPFFNWINLEIYKVSKDRKFLSDAYESGKKYLKWLLENRDLDRDGTFEWGPYGIIENVRDWYNAVFQVSAERFLDIDKEDISDELECLDLTLMVLKEIRSLAAIAIELGNKSEANDYLKKAENLSELINERMWDTETQFFYSINKQDHSFRFLTRDLRRQEIIGFLPLWAEAVDSVRALKLVEVLLDTNKFWRRYGIPTLSADDEWYSPNVDYCCKWNGPVWLLWNYMVFQGLKLYGFHEIADQVADKMLLAVTTQLKKNHNFWESYSPDNEAINSPSNYIWDSIIARVLIDKYHFK
jgi:hypothetical protein